MSEVRVFGVMLSNRIETATSFQEIISRYGCNIKTRIGLHTVTDNVCSPSGIILLELIGEDSDISSLYDEIAGLEGVQIQKMVFSGKDL
jgi:hypothetical protein